MSTDGENHPTDNNSDGRRAVTRRPARPYWIGVLVVAMGAIWLYGASQLPLGARYSAVGPGLFVLIAGGGLVLFGSLLIIQIWRGERFEPQDAEDAAANAPMDKRAFITALLAIALPIGLMKPIGLPLTATIAFVLVCNAFGSRRLLLDVLIGAVLASVAWFLFTRLGLQLGRFFPPLGF